METFTGLIAIAVPILVCAAVYRLKGRSKSVAYHYVCPDCKKIIGQSSLGTDAASNLLGCKDCGYEDFAAFTPHIKGRYHA